VYKILTRKLNDVSLSGINANNAVFFSPRVDNSSSSYIVIEAKLSRLNFSNREASVI